MRALLGCIPIAILAVACSPTAGDVTPATQNQIAAAMQRYQVAARSVDPDAIAAFYTLDGTLFEPGINPIHTRDSIRAFIASFPGVRVDSATATPDTIEILGNTALYWGSYFEKLAFPGQPLSEQHGKFVAEWVRESDGMWRIRRMFRVPLPSQAGKDN